MKALIESNSGEHRLVKIKVGRALYRITEQHGQLRILADRDFDGEFAVKPCSANEVELNMWFPEYAEVDNRSEQ